MSHKLRRTRRRLLRARRGVVSILAMMFLVLFGSLCAAMAIASRGNIRTASTHLELTRALSAAETGLIVAQNRLNEAAARFVVSHSDIDPDFVDKLWNGGLDDFGDFTILPNPQGYDDAPESLSEALLFLHGLDVNIVVRSESDLEEPELSAAWPDADTEIYAADAWVVTPIVAVTEQPEGQTPPAAYQIVYAPLANGTDVRVIVIGYDFVENRAPLTRTIMQDFRMAKRVDHAIISPSRVLVGKNVQIVGSIGARFTDVDFEHADPITSRSDFFHIDAALDSKLDALYAVLGDTATDVDSDNRLRVEHPTESDAIPGGYTGDESDPDPASAFADVTGDGYVDEFDVFINHFDSDDDGRVSIATELVDGSGQPIDADLAYLIDSSLPDRNRNGVWGFEDTDGDGRYDEDPELDEEFLDWTWVKQGDSMEKVYLDHELGYLDGYIDYLDRYVKVDGRLMFTVAESAWSAANEDYLEEIAGAVRPDDDDPPVTFDADDVGLPEVTVDSFSDSELALQAAADGDDFWQQVADNLGIGVEDLATYTESHNSGDSFTDDSGNTVYYPRYLRLDPDDDLDGMPDNADSAYFEAMPFSSPTPTDWYYRPVFEHMIFRDVQVPMGLNALFVDCTFVGATYIRAHQDNYNVLDPDKSHIDWNEYGKMVFDADLDRPVLDRARFAFGDDADEYNEDDGCVDCPPLDDSVLPPEARPPSQMLSLATDPLDKADIPESQVGAFPADDYDMLPDPLIIEAVRDIGAGPELVPTRVHDTRMYSNNLRFHDCLFVGSVVSDLPQEYVNVRNKLQFTGATRFLQEHPTDDSLNPDEEDLEELVKSSMMLPNFSVDVGTFNAPEEQEVKLQGAIVAGVLDVRGNAEINGSLLLTFEPVYGEGPLQDMNGNPIGNPADFNATLGYFGPDDGDQESLDPMDLPETEDGTKYVGWDLDGDGIADLGPDEEPTEDQLDAGAVIVPFNGFGRIRINFDPSMTLPDGIMLPLRADPVSNSYREGKL